MDFSLIMFIVKKKTPFLINLKIIKHETILFRSIDKKVNM
jgi:hypothetical protein